MKTNDRDDAARLGIEVVSSAEPTALTLNGNLAQSVDFKERAAVQQAPPDDVARAVEPRPFLRVPPFPGAHLRYFDAVPGEAVDRSAVVERLRALRVGGSFWAAQPPVPTGAVLLRTASGAAVARRLANGAPIVWWNSPGMDPDAALDVSISGLPCDPWHMLSGASALVGETDAEVLLIATLLGVPCFGVDGQGELTPSANDLSADLLDTLCRTRFIDPFSDKLMDAMEAAELCGFWRRLIDSNRGLCGGVGFAFWKQEHVAPLMWDGSLPFRFLRSADAAKPGAAVAVWRSKTSSALLGALERKGCPTVEVEDGFLRSRGLGADCIPPLSITVDRLGAHFDPSQPSELELLLEHGRFDEALIRRAGDLRRLIIEAGIGKYDRSTGVIPRPAGTRRHILVPGQVEDDRAVQTGGCGLTSNLELLARVSAEAPDAYILYKPHPDVLAGHRRGAVARDACLRFASEIVGELPIASLIAMVDEVHVNTSLAGFEALLRGKPVTTHGVPFYAGWGLTTDRGPVPARRTRRRSIDELVAATLLLYPRYLDPNSGLPCPPETIVSRLTEVDDKPLDLLVGMRRFQGKLMRGLRSLVQ